MTRPAGVRVQRVRPAKSGLVQRVQRVVVGGCAANIYKTKQPPWRARENKQTALRAEKPYNRAFGARKCTPSAACGGVSPGGGDSSGSSP